MWPANKMTTYCQLKYKAHKWPLKRGYSKGEAVKLPFWNSLIAPSAEETSRVNGERQPDKFEFLTATVAQQPPCSTAEHEVAGSIADRNGRISMWEEI